MRTLAPALAAGVVMLALATAGDLAGVVGAAAPLAASVALLAVTPGLPAARPAALGGGYVIGAAAGLLAATTVGVGIAAAALATALALAAMQRTGTVHPPAVAAACAVALAPNAPWHVAAAMAAGGLLLATGAPLARRHLLTPNR